MLAARPGYLKKNADTVKRMLAGLHEAVQIFHEEAGMESKIATNYGLKVEDAKAYVEARTRLTMLQMVQNRKDFWRTQGYQR